MDDSSIRNWKSRFFPESKKSKSRFDDVTGLRK